MMQPSKFFLASAIVVLCAACGQHEGHMPAATVLAAPDATAQADPDARCKSWGIQPGSPGYQRCVDGMTAAENAGAGEPQSAEQTQRELEGKRADMAHQSDDMRKQVADEMKAAARNPNCVTVTNGGNTSVSCP